MSVLSRFKSRYGHLKKVGLEIVGMASMDYSRNTSVIAISHPLVFDNRLIPSNFEGTAVRSSIHGELPKEFQIDQSTPNWYEKEYIWAPERFEKFVDRSIDELRKAFDNPEMSREEILDALCFGDFEGHKTDVEKWINEGKIPAYAEKKN
ncbi:MAG: hypothetical protein R2813_09790 [Flavobacteriales bacterium]